MGVIPKKIVERIQFYENHTGPFTTNAVAIGISSADATSLDAKTVAARDAYSAHQAAKQAAEAATTALYNAMAALSTEGAALIEKIRAHAKQTGNDNIFNLAQIPPPATPQPKGAPGAVTAFTATLTGNGALETAWECANPPGTMGTIYQIYRRIDGAGGFVYVGGSGEKRYEDDTIPAGTFKVEYQIQAVRSRKVGPWTTFTVLFSTDSGTGVTSAAVQGAPKLAA
jgi:hypothetical protein